MDLDTYTARVEGREVSLTRKELELLFTLTSHRDKVFSRDNLLESIWGYEYFGDSRTVDSHVKRLRAKLDAAEHPGWQIRTVWGIGYTLEVTPHEK